MEKVPWNISDDPDEASFASLAQQANDEPPNCPTQPRLSTDPNFEFCRSSPITSPSPAELLFSDGHLLPHSYPMNNPTNTSKSSSTSSLSSLSSNTVSRSSSIGSNSSSKSSGGGSARRRLRKSSESVSAAVPKRASFQLPGPSLVATKSGSGNCRAVAGRAEARPKKEAGKQQRGLFRCIVSACRECHALEPSKAVWKPARKKALQPR